MSPSAEDSVGPMEFTTSTTSPGWEKCRNHSARSSVRLMHPCETFAEPWEATDQGAPCTNSPLLEMRVAYFTPSARYPPGASTARPKVEESIVTVSNFSSTTCAPLWVGLASLPALIGYVCTTASLSYTVRVCAAASATETCFSPMLKETERFFPPQTPSPKSTP